MENRIKELRTASKMSQQRLATLAKTTPQQIGHLERSERNLTQEWMERISSALGVSSAELLPGMDNITQLTPKVGEEVVGTGREPDMGAVTSVPEIDVRAGMGGGGEAAIDYWHDGNGNTQQTDAIKALYQGSHSFVDNEIIHRVYHLSKPFHATNTSFLPKYLPCWHPHLSLREILSIIPVDIAIEPFQF